MIDPGVYIHQQEEKSLKGLEDILFQEEIKEYYCEYVEKAQIPDLLGKTVRATPYQFKELYKMIEEIAKQAEIEIPNCYIYEDFYYGVEAKGIEKPWIEISSKTVADFDEKEIRFLMGKEICNIQLEHTQKYAIIKEYLQRIGKVKMLGVDTVEKANKALLYKWWRISNYTSDCYGLLMCGDIETSIRVILKTILNSCYLAQQVNIREYMKQAEEINALDGAAYNFSKLDECVPYACFRIKNLIAYASSERGIRALSKLGYY